VFFLLGPIFQREFITVPRRVRHYVARVAYLGTLWVVGITAWLATVGWTRTATLGETARFGPLLFQLLTTVQLALFLFFAALSSASSVSQEKDRRTFVLLLMTDMSNFEIVLGKLLGSLLQIGLLLLATVPLWMFIILLGGVSLGQVLQALLIVAATVLAAGSLGSLVALWRERTFQALALTTLFLVLYLCLARGLTVVPELFPALAGFDAVKWQRWLDPFRALQSVQAPTETLEAGVAPAYGFTAMMLLLSGALNALGLYKLRVWNPSGEPIMQAERPEDIDAKDAELAKDESKRAAAHAAPGKARAVGPNPILWREIFTRAYGRRPLLVKLAYLIALAIICWSALAPVIDHKKSERPFEAAYGLVPVCVLSMLLVAAQAATAITSERDTGALDLLLVTDLSPQEFIFGKLGGIIYNTKEYLLPPLILGGVYAWYGCMATPPANHPEMGGSMNFSSFVFFLVDALVLLAFAMVLGIHVALRAPNSRAAILYALSTVFFLSVGTLVCVALILINRQFEYQWYSFLFFAVAGVGGLYWVLNYGRPSGALAWASIFCPAAVLYTVLNVVVAKPGSQESADPVMPFVVIVGAFGFTLAAMLIPLLSEFDVALGRTSGGAD
jgi:ABC-type transport system involved in multi-copper enzyme maturation permease subunit